MSGRIPQHFIDELIARADLVELIGARVPLKKQGKEYKACCPFHGEKTPSFTVVPDKQFYHCFGCGAHGTALGFLMEHDHLSFVEAVEDLAARLGMEVPREHQQPARPSRAEGLFQTLEQAAEFYRHELKRSARAREYLKARGLTGETAARFALGYAPDAWDALLRQFGAGEAQRTRLLEAGLLIERERKPDVSPGYYDRFRDRVMFPIRDARGRPLGFGGRVLDKGEPKYLNSPETELFHKGRELYGLYEARQSSRTLNRLLVVEGYMDVVRLHQAGITCAVATLGTATTPDHLVRIFRICNELTFCFDGDRAGRAAAWRALENSLSQVREGRQIRFLFLPDGHDPDSLVGAQGREAFESRMAHATPLSEYFISHLSAQVDLDTVDGRARLGALARPLIERIPAGIYRELLAEEVARIVRLPAHRMGIAAAPEPRAASREPAGRRGPPVVARRNLVRQSVHLLVHYPEIADKVRNVSALANVDRPGVALLTELISQLQDQPCASTGALLERWRGRPELEHLAKLASLECLIPDAAGAARELADGLQQLLEEGAMARREQLLGKHSRAGLTDAEKAELQALLQSRGARAPDRDGRT
ncbi:MAG TPA: DNA primase [Steroidobacter sp.]|nr:DNA primase [Steroidobacteraceae bacterium]HLS80378.1 DNA primase [Steroidobacter sp.]